MDDTDLDLLNAALARHLLPGAGADGSIASNGPERGPAAILQRIGETMLPRQLVFRAGDRRVLAVLAANRQLLRILDADPAAMADPALLNCSFADTTARTPGQLATLVRRLAPANAAISVDSRRVTDPGGPSEMGIPADLIGRHLNQPAGGQLDRFLPAVASSSSALVQTSAGEITEAVGDDGTLADLLDLARTIWGEEAEETDQDAGDAPQLVLFSTDAAGAGGLCTTLIRAGSRRVLMQHDNADALAIAAAWTAVR